jgi:hypothetical protein
MMGHQKVFGKPVGQCDFVHYQLGVEIQMLLKKYKNYWIDLVD